MTKKINSDFSQKIEKYFHNSVGNTSEKISQFPKYVREVDLQRFLFRCEVFKKILPIHGSIVEMGVLFGGGLMTWAKLSSILEPRNYSRKIIGFDTFSGFPSISNQDKINSKIAQKLKIKSAKKGEYSSNSFKDLLESIKLHDAERPIGDITKTEIIKGDIKNTLPNYLKHNPHLIVSLLNLDLDLYKPTKFALKNLINRMPKGSIICFDELNHPHWPGETIAVMEEIGLPNIKINRFEFAPLQSYAIIE